mmetsp:Transcript_5820/g.16344  ORF Transcript_5820/g.16344 Transcript_5820/m.16344 type:complete len:212 (+) Transcript_5820:383-1018(+)
MGIVACRNQDDVWLEASCSRPDNLFKHCHHCVVSTVAWQRQVDGVPLAVALANLQKLSCARIAPRLMRADEEHRGVVKEGVMRSIPVVDVEVEYHHLLQPMYLLCISRHDGDVVEDTETHRPLRDGVVSWVEMQHGLHIKGSMRKGVPIQCRSKETAVEDLQSAAMDLVACTRRTRLPRGHRSGVLRWPPQDPPAASLRLQNGRPPLTCLP